MRRRMKRQQLPLDSRPNLTQNKGCSSCSSSSHRSSVYCYVHQGQEWIRGLRLSCWWRHKDRDEGGGRDTWNTCPWLIHSSWQQGWNYLWIPAYSWPWFSGNLPCLDDVALEWVFRMRTWVAWGRRRDVCLPVSTPFHPNTTSHPKNCLASHPFPLSVCIKSWEEGLWKSVCRKRGSQVRRRRRQRCQRIRETKGQVQDQNKKHRKTRRMKGSFSVCFVRFSWVSCESLLGSIWGCVSPVSSLILLLELCIILCEAGCFLLHLLDITYLCFSQVFPLYTSSSLYPLASFGVSSVMILHILSYQRYSPCYFSWVFFPSLFFNCSWFSSYILLLFHFGFLILS